MARSRANRHRLSEARERLLHGKPKAEYPYDFVARGRPSGYFGKKCRIIGKGKVPDVAWVEFENGRRFLVLRRSLTKR
jgi:hypothetical protein